MTGQDDRLAERLRGFGPLGIAAMLVILLVGNLPVAPAAGLLVLLWARLSRTPWPALGFVRPRSWVATLAGGIAFGMFLKLLMKSVVLPLLGADPVNQAFHYLAGNRAALPAAIYGMIVGAGFGEETVFRGYLFERLGRLLGRRRPATVLVVPITSLGFGAAHYAGQGSTGVEQATIVGLVFGTIYALTGRIVLLMVAHAAFDLTALAIIYWDAETRVARFFFS